MFKIGRGLGRIQKLILEILEKNKDYYKDGWYDVETLTLQIVNGIDCFEKDVNKMIEDGYREPTESEKQSVYRAIRRLEILGYIESRIRAHSPVFFNGKDTKTKELKIKV